MGRWQQGPTGQPLVRTLCAPLTYAGKWAPPSSRWRVPFVWGLVGGWGEVVSHSLVAQTVSCTRYADWWARPRRFVNNLPDGTRHGRTCRTSRIHRWPSSAGVYNPIKSRLLLNPPAPPQHNPNIEREREYNEREREIFTAGASYRENDEGERQLAVTCVIDAPRDPALLGRRAGG
jgi:hypothetical protein